MSDQELHLCEQTCCGWCRKPIGLKPSIEKGKRLKCATCVQDATDRAFRFFDIVAPISIGLIALGVVGKIVLAVTS